MKRMRKNQESTKRGVSFKTENDDYMPNSKLKGLVKRCFACAAAIVVFFTTYSMILPAITATIPTCGIEEHVHSSECYRTERTLICDNTDPDHVHAEECYREREILTCGKEEHVHSDECYSDVGVTEAVRGELPTDENPNGEDGKSPPYAEIDPTDPDSTNPSEPGSSSGLKNQDLSKYNNLLDFVNSAGGEIKSILYDKDGQKVEFISEASGKGYSYHWTMSSPYVTPGSYYFFLPKGMQVEEGFLDGDIIIRNSLKIGTYKVSDDSTYILFTFDEIAGDYRDIVGSISMSVEFEEKITSSIQKTGYFIGENGEFDGYFHFDICLKIPGDREGVPKRQWTVTDNSLLKIKSYTSWDYDFSDEENLKNMHVYISYGDTPRYEIFNVDDVYDDRSQEIAYYVDPDTKELTLVNRCYCTGENCVYVDSQGKCTCQHNHLHKDWCSCWSLGENATIDIEYKTNKGPDGNLILLNQNLLAKYDISTFVNNAVLNGSYRNSSGDIVTNEYESETQVNFSNFYEKRESGLASKGNDYISTFSIEFNKDKADISKLDVDGDDTYDSRVVVIDNMKNLKFMASSMSITAEDIDGNTFELIYGTDFTVDVQHSTESDGDRVEISLLKLGRYKYNIEYRAQMIPKEGSTNVKIENDISFDFYDQTQPHAKPTYTYSRNVEYDGDWAARLYSINITKVDISKHEKVLEGAEYGLYSLDGFLIAQRTTGEDGKCTFSTKGTDLMIGVETLYYIQEITPPHGYTLDTRKYWFYFSKERSAYLEKVLQDLYPNSIVTHQPPDTETDDYIFDTTLEDEELFILPATGGWGTETVISVGLLLLAAATGCIIFLKLHKKEGTRTP